MDVTYKRLYMALSTKAVNSTATVTNGNQKRCLISPATVTKVLLQWPTAFRLLNLLHKHFRQSLNDQKSGSKLLKVPYFAASFFIALAAGLYYNTWLPQLAAEFFSNKKEIYAHILPGARFKR